MLYQRIRCFLEVANSLNFTTAAQNLYMSQQAMTKQIAALESELGVKLFYRSTRRVILTAAGSALRDDFIHINSQISASIRRARDLAQLQNGLLRVGFLSALSRRDVILPVTDHLFKTYPETQFDIRLLDFVELRNQLLDHKLDLCVTTSNDWKLWPGVWVSVLRQKQFQVVYSDRHPLARAEQVTLEELGRHTQLTLPNDNLMSGVELWGKRVPFRRAVPCPDISTLMVRLALGEGFALLTQVFDGHEDPSLRYWPVPFPEAHAEVVCICREEEGQAVRDIIRGIGGPGVIRLSPEGKRA